MCQRLAVEREVSRGGNKYTIENVAEKTTVRTGRRFTGVEVGNLKGGKTKVVNRFHDFGDV